MNRQLDDLRMSAQLRYETPEPESRQGRRNARGVQLLDSEGAISHNLEACLAHIFAKYCLPRPQKRPGLLVPPSGAFLTAEGLDEWAKDTNGAPFDEESKEELLMFMDCTDEGGLTFEGFLQVYQLQTEADEEETWRDLSIHGFDRTLRLVATRREDYEMDDIAEMEMEDAHSPIQHDPNAIDLSQ